MSRFVKPETCVLTLANGDSLMVKKRLNRGEQAEMFTHFRRPDGTVDAVAVGLATVLAYLIDWSLQEENVPLAELDYAERATVMNGLDPDDFNEIRNAIDAHAEKVDQERAAKKARPAGENGSSATCLSAADTAGPTTTSPPSSTLTSIR